MVTSATNRSTTIMTTRHSIIFTFNFWSGHLYDNKTDKEYCNNYDVEFTYNSVLKGFSSVIVKLLYTHYFSVTPSRCCLVTTFFWTLFCLLCIYVWIILDGEKFFTVWVSHHNCCSIHWTSDRMVNLQLTTLVQLQVQLTDRQQLRKQDTNLHLLLIFGHNIYTTTRPTMTTATIMMWNSYKPPNIYFCVIDNLFGTQMMWNCVLKWCETIKMYKLIYVLVLNKITRWKWLVQYSTTTIAVFTNESTVQYSIPLQFQARLQFQLHSINNWSVVQYSTNTNISY